jgi:hypothetical protein
VPGRTEIAGDVIVAMQGGARSMIQFSKTPFPLLTAQTLDNRWEIEFPPQKKRFAGRGTPPKRLIWLYLPRVLSGTPPPENWVWQEGSKGWRLENGETREWIEGYFNQTEGGGT